MHGNNLLIKPQRPSNEIIKEGYEKPKDLDLFEFWKNPEIESCVALLVFTFGLIIKLSYVR